MPSLDKAFSSFLKAQKRDQSDASLAVNLGIAESSLYRLINGDQSATLRCVDHLLSRLGMSAARAFGDEIHRKRSSRG